MSQLRSIPCSKRPFRISCFSMPTEFERRERRERERERERERVLSRDSFLRSDDRIQVEKRNETNAKRRSEVEKRMSPSCLRVVELLSKLSLDSRPGVFKSIEPAFIWRTSYN